MKYILLVMLLVCTVFAKDDKQKVTLGFGPFMQSQPYKDVDPLFIASPVIFYDNGLVYIRWSRAGIYFFGDKQEDYAWGFSLSVQPRTYGYESSDIYGMDEREDTWEGGLAFSAQADNAYIEVMALTDILNEYDSYIIKSEMGYDIQLGKLALYPSLIVVYQSKDFVNYYYGVTQEEAQKRGETAYNPSAGFQVGVQTYIKYPLTKKLSVLVNLRADRIPKSASDSPIVDNNYIYSGLASLIYTFEY